ncbi:sugar/nucleoside kinase (ribokinase family) [Solirubrobacter pauli]|uniref:Sugar/nucleoside kinase (Ribokinase family) n=1 Tax=Solirubrobacter pauli TaxID=166793 RepID=A0A660L8U4_9ACTN|nr:PfkB family carbohydrate kinase [Solirubrobacter pauli]RKQ90695.1 sugar/nucleoside kinase (ribokinase family) [Solirubrobacter pauli]
MSVDLACAEPAFLDLTLVGLDQIPKPGEERLAQDFLRSPGGGAITAVGAARLGLTSSLTSPLGDDAVGMLLRTLLADEGVRWDGRLVERTPVTVIMPADGDRAMATFDPGESVTASELAAVEPRAVVLSIPRLPLAPAGARTYVSVGDLDARALAGRELPAELASARALLVNEREALLLSGAPDAETAAAQLAQAAPVAIVTLGPDGALAAGAEGTVHVEGVAVEAVDTTGAGDLFAAAYVWADHWGAALEQRLRWAVLYASLSVRVATAVAGAVTLRALLEEGASYGLTSPVRQPAAMKEDQ